MRGERERSLAINWTVREKHMETQMEQNVQLISEMIKNAANDVVPTICIFSLLVSKRHLDLTTSRKSPINKSVLNWTFCQLLK